MGLEPQKKEVINETVTALDEGVVILTSGDMIYAKSLNRYDESNKDFLDNLSNVIGETPIEEIPNEENCLIVENRIEKSYDDVGHWILIPEENIFDVIEINLDQRTTRTSNHRESFYSTPIEPELFYETNDTALNSQLCHLEPMYTAQSIEIEDHIKWGKAVFNDDQPIYCDWKYFSNRKGGMTGIGLGLLGISGSASWNDALYSDFIDRISSDIISLTRTQNEQEVNVSGYIDILITKEGYETKEMGGEEWVAGIISNDKVNEIGDLERTDWRLAYFKRKSAIYPINAWENIQDKVIIFAEVVNSDIEFDLQVEHFLKVRAIAYLEEIDC